jgi:radical SAM superfamily enzyme YgiQ (UPF0313 family)
VKYKEIKVMNNNFSVTLVQCPCWSRETPPVAISLLGSILKKKGIKVYLFDLNNEFYHIVSDEHKRLWSQEEYTFWSSSASVKGLTETYSDEIDRTVEEILSIGSRLIGFTVYFTTLHFTREIIRRLKKQSPETIIVLGGPSTAEYSGGLKLLNNKDVDAIVLREGDETLPEMCAILEEKGHLECIPGLVFKKDGNIINGGLRAPIPSLDALPFPDYSVFDLSRYATPNRLDIFSSRSCVNKCHFCDERTYFGRFRIRSGKSLFEEVQYHLSLFPYIRFFNFSDSVMNGSLKTLREFSELLINNNVNITWGGQGVIRRDMSPELLNLMARAGCVYISYGIESGSDAVLKSMNKGRFTTEMAARVLRDTHNAGIRTYANFMFGYPTETEEDFLMTLKFIRENHEYIDGVSPSQSFTVIVPNTYLYEHPEEFNLNPEIHHLYWETKDGSNTYPVRFDRYERFCKLCMELGIGGVGVTAEKIDKWKLLGSYYRYKGDYKKAIECYKKDLLKHGYSPETVRSFIACYANREKIEDENILRGIEELVSYYDGMVKFLKDQLVEEKRRYERQSEVLRRNIKKRDEEIARLKERLSCIQVTG